MESNTTTTHQSFDYYSSCGLGLFEKSKTTELYSNDSWIKYVNANSKSKTAAVNIKNAQSMSKFEVYTPSVSSLVEYMEASFPDLPFNLGESRFLVSRSDKTYMYNKVVKYITDVKKPSSVLEIMGSISLMVYYTSLKSSTASYTSIDNIPLRNERIVSYAHNLLMLEDRPLDIIETEEFEYALGSRRKYLKDLLGFCSVLLDSDLESIVSSAYPVFFADDIESISFNYRLIKQKAVLLDRKAKQPTKKSKSIPTKQPSFISNGIFR